MFTGKYILSPERITTMRKSTKLIAMLLVIVMSASLLCVPGLAEEKDEKDKVVVTCIGDSIANGFSQCWDCAKTVNGSPYNSNDTFITETYGPSPIVYMSPEKAAEKHPTLYYSTSETEVFCAIDGYIDGAVTQKDKDHNKALIERYEKRTLRTFPAQVAARLNGHDVSEYTSFEDYYKVIPYNSLTCSGLRAKDLRYLLDPQYKVKIDKAYEADPWNDPLWNYFSFIRDDGRIITKENYDRKLAETDVLVVEIGGNDVFSASLFGADLTGDLDIASLLPDFLKNLTKFLPEAMENYNWVLDYCRKVMKPDAKIVLVGIYDYYLTNDLAAFNFNLTEDMMSILYNAFIAVSATFNSDMRLYADTHKNVYYVDSNQTETYNNESQSGDTTHPSLEGHDYIARRIMSALPKEYNGKCRYDITIDLDGAYKPGTDRVVSVTVDGLPVTNYEINDDYSLTIHYYGPGAMFINVGIVGEKLKTTTWQATYNVSDGYRTYQLFKVSDVFSVTGKLFNRTFETLKSFVSSLFGNLFK